MGLYLKDTSENSSLPLSFSSGVMGFSGGSTSLTASIIALIRLPEIAALGIETIMETTEVTAPIISVKYAINAVILGMVARISSL